MTAPNAIKVVAALGLLGVATYGLVNYWRDDGGIPKNRFFYDESERKLFTGPREGIPPVRGLDGKTEDAVGAVVISTNGNPKDKSSWAIAYLEKFSPELKREMENARASGGSPQMGRVLAQANRFVRRPADSNWFPLSSPEGDQIINGWAVPGANGITPIVCTP